VSEAWSILHPAVDVALGVGMLEELGPGDIQIVWGDPAAYFPEFPTAVGATAMLPTHDRGLIVLEVCSVRVMAHELGHALGLVDVDDPTRLMHWADPSGFALSVDDRAVLDRRPSPNASGP
jgi:hypothetical protein